MSNTLLYETLFYGNLELSYTNKKIKNLSLKEIYQLYKENNNLTLDKYWTWRFYKNYKVLYYIFENDIFVNIDTHNIFIDIIEQYIILAKNNGFALKNIDESNFNEAIICLLVKEMRDKINILANLCNYDLKKIKKKYINLFSNILVFMDNRFIMCDYLLPEESYWSPSWNISIDENQFILPSVDLLLDYYFKYNKVRFNSNMVTDIRILKERLKLLQEKTTIYYIEKIKPYIKNLTNHIFNTFPYKLIYEDYYDLCLENENVFVPNILSHLDLKKINKDLWLLSLFPNYITAFLVGFPVVTSDIPNDKNIKKILDIINYNGMDKYLKDLYQRNKKLIELKSMDIECGNNTEDGSILDLTYNAVEEYNIDDTILFFNEGVYHIFTCPEFNDIISKELNPYNRNNMPLITNMMAVIKFKKKIKRQLSSRYLEAELINTIEENIENIKEGLSKDININNNINNIPNSLFNLFFSSHS